MLFLVLEDEFVFLFTKHSRSYWSWAEGSTNTDVFKPSFNLRGQAFLPRCSAGVSYVPLMMVRKSKLLTKADIVLYKAKESNKGDAVFLRWCDPIERWYDYAVEKAVRNRLRTCGEFSVFYQPFKWTLTPNSSKGLKRCVVGTIAYLVLCLR